MHKVSESRDDGGFGMAIACISRQVCRRGCGRWRLRCRGWLGNTKRDGQGKRSRARTMILRVHRLLYKGFFNGVRSVAARAAHEQGIPCHPLHTDDIARRPVDIHRRRRRHPRARQHAPRQPAILHQRLHVQVVHQQRRPQRHVAQQLRQRERRRVKREKDVAERPEVDGPRKLGLVQLQDAQRGVVQPKRGQDGLHGSAAQLAALGGHGERDGRPGGGGRHVGARSGRGG